MLLDNFLEKDNDVQRKLLSRFSEYLKHPNVKKFLFENDYLPLFIEIFKGSNSFEDGGIRSEILLKFKGYLTQKDLEKIVATFIENDQNERSFKAQDNICELLNWGLYGVPHMYIDKIRELEDNRKPKELN